MAFNLVNRALPDFGDVGGNCRRGLAPRRFRSAGQPLARQTGRRAIHIAELMRDG